MIYFIYLSNKKKFIKVEDIISIIPPLYIYIYIYIYILKTRLFLIYIQQNIKRLKDQS